MKSAIPSLEEVIILAHGEQIYEQHRHRLVQPLYVKITDAAGQITEYEYYPEIDQDLNTSRTSSSPETPSFRLPIMGPCY
jgi:hypothetical protein